MNTPRLAPRLLSGISVIAVLASAPAFSHNSCNCAVNTPNHTQHKFTTHSHHRKAAAPRVVRVDPNQQRYLRERQARQRQALARQQQINQRRRAAALKQQQIAQARKRQQIVAQQRAHEARKRQQVLAQQRAREARRLHPRPAAKPQHRVVRVQQPRPVRRPVVQQQRRVVQFQQPRPTRRFQAKPTTHSHYRVAAVQQRAPVVRRVQPRRVQPRAWTHSHYRTSQPSYTVRRAAPVMRVVRPLPVYAPSSGYGTYVSYSVGRPLSYGFSGHRSYNRGYARQHKRYRHGRNMRMHYSRY